MQVKLGLDDDCITGDRMTFTERLRTLFKNFLDASGQRIYKMGITANLITLVGLAGNFIAAFFIGIGNLLVGGIFILLMGPLDAFDGAVARAAGEITPFGAFLDSVTDRYSELVIYLGLLAYFLRAGDANGILLVFIAAAGSVLVSYTRARAQGIGLDVKVGFMTRVERYLVLVPGILFSYPKISLWIIAILANFTAFQRILEVYKITNSVKKEK